jgi:integrase
MAVTIRLWKERIRMDGTAPVIAVVYYGKYKKRISLNVWLEPDKWNERKEQIKSPKGIEVDMALHIDAERRRLEQICMHAKMKKLSLYEFKKALMSEAEQTTISYYLGDLLRAREGGSKAYVAAWNAFIEKCGNKKPGEYTSVDVIRFVDHIRAKYSESTASMYFNYVRGGFVSMARRGMKYDVVIFEDVKVAMPKKIRYALSDDELIRVMRAVEKYPKNRMLLRFKISLFCCGIDISDLQKLDWDSVEKNQVICYRQKTKQLIKFTIQPELGDLRQKIEKVVVNSRHEHMIEARVLSGVQKFSVKMARHCWATIAKNCNVPKDVISEAMGHKTGGITNVYLMDYDTSVIDQANRAVIDYVQRLLER